MKSTVELVSLFFLSLSFPRVFICDGMRRMALNNVPSPPLLIFLNETKLSRLAPFLVRSHCVCVCTKKERDKMKRNEASQRSRCWLWRGSAARRLNEITDNSSRPVKKNKISGCDGAKRKRTREKQTENEKKMANNKHTHSLKKWNKIWSV